MNLNGKKIFIECSPGIGDLVVLSPILRGLKEKYPDCKLTIMSKRSSLRVIERLPYVDSICPMDEGKARIIRGMWGQDCVIFINYKPMLLALAKGMRIPHRAGPCKNKYKKWGLCTHYFPYDEKSPVDLRQTDYFMEHICEALDIPAFQYSEETEISAPTGQEIRRAEEKLEAKGHLSGRSYICISPFGNTEVDLPVNKVREIAEKILGEYGDEIVFLGGRRNEELAQMLEGLSSERLIDMSGETTLADMIVILRGARLHLCADSGPMHISSGLRTPTLPVFTSGNPRRWAPRAYCHPLSLNLSCSPCKGGRHLCRDKKCVNDITAKMILACMGDAEREGMSGKKF